jgi:hypothetical protein
MKMKRLIAGHGKLSKAVKDVEDSEAVENSGEVVMKMQGCCGQVFFGPGRPRLRTDCGPFGRATVGHF